jgi:hypothetical protein
LLEKRRGTSTSLYLAKDRLADEVRSDAIPDAAGGEGGHGAAKPDGVIHRYVFNRLKTAYIGYTRCYPCRGYDPNGLTQPNVDL